MTNVCRCPQCFGALVPVTNRSLFLNDDQFDSQKAGDYYCETCPGNDRGKMPKCYWWESEVRNVSSGVIPDEVIESEFRGTNFGTSNHRQLVEQGVLKRLTGYHICGTMQRILFRLGLTDANNEPTNDGKALVWNAFGCNGDRFHSIIPERNHPTRTSALAAETNRRIGQVDALRYIDGWITSHIGKDNASKSYIAGLEEIRINVQAARERIGQGEPMEATSECCGVSPCKVQFALTEYETMLCVQLPDVLVSIADFHDTRASMAAAMGYREITDHYSARAEELRTEAKRIEATW